MIKLLLLITGISAFKFSSWYVGDYDPEKYPINWDIYTHVHNDDPIVDNDGFAKCNRSNIHLSNIAHSYNRKILWGLGALNISSILWDNNRKLRYNYLTTIPKAMQECQIDGIEVDYEFTNRIKNIGIVSPKDSTIYSQFLADLKQSIGSDKIVGADISIWGIGKGEWILGVLPWINVTMLNNGDFDYVNTMSYHWSMFGSLWAWKKDAFFIDLWGIDRSRVNIGIPYYSEEFWLRKNGEPTWNSLSKNCPNINYSNNTCNNIVFIGKKMNYELGKWVKQQGFGGVFPWALNYDSDKYNNSLIYWLNKGVQEN